MEYQKSPKSFEEQATILIDRGLQTTKESLIPILDQINYYRFTAYLFPFRKKDSESFIDGTTIDKVLSLYQFDRDLRMLVLSGLEVIEVAIFRTQMVELLSNEFGSTCYLDRNMYTRGKRADKFHADLVLKSIDQFYSSDSDIKRFIRKYTKNSYLPFWIIAEKFSFGTMTHLYANLREKYKRKISYRYNLLPVILESWLHSLNKTRNIYAHHSRLWNKNLGHLPKFPQIDQNQSIGQFSSEQAKLINNSVFINLSIT